MERENVRTNYLFVDDMLDINEKPIPKESIENMPVPQRGKVISRTFGTFSTREFEKILSERLKGNVTDFLPTEPIKVSEMLINAEGEYEHNPIAKAFCGTDKDTYRIFDVPELRQIAEHLLVYCNHNVEAEE